MASTTKHGASKYKKLGAYFPDANNGNCHVYAFYNKDTNDDKLGDKEGSKITSKVLPYDSSYYCDDSGNVHEWY